MPSLASLNDGATSSLFGQMDPATLAAMRSVSKRYAGLGLRDENRNPHTLEFLQRLRPVVDSITSFEFGNVHHGGMYITCHELLASRSAREPDWIEISRRPAGGWNVSHDQDDVVVRSVSAVMQYVARIVGTRRFNITISANYHTPPAIRKVGTVTVYTGHSERV